MEVTSTEGRILDVLEDDAQASYAEIAKRADVSKPTVRKYIRKMEEEGVIVGYSADVDPKKLSETSIAVVGLDVASERYVEVTRTLRNLNRFLMLMVLLRRIHHSFRSDSNNRTESNHIHRCITHRRCTLTCDPLVLDLVSKRYLEPTLAGVTENNSMKK
jgi:DNA-binding Lrp family transcriptional regulator